MNAPQPPIRRALVSVFDKTGLAELASGLHDIGAEIVSTGTTAQAIRDLGVPVTQVREVTGFPEIMDGRIKTLHPTIHGAILADRSEPAHVGALHQLGVTPIDLVVVNLYSFSDAAAVEDAEPADVLNMIDIGGPAMVRAAAKNHPHVGVVVDPADYPTLVGQLREGEGLTAEMRRRLAAKAFAHTAAYDAEIAAWFHRNEEFPAQFAPVYTKAADLRYGENPHQNAAYYVEPNRRGGLASATQLHGKELSYNNILDTDAAWAMANDFTDPCVAVVKHNNPAGIAVAGTLADAYRKALASDPTSAFGGVVAVNRPVGSDLASPLTEIFTEVVAAPGYTDDALEVLRAKPNLRLLEVLERPRDERQTEVRSISGGLLVQDADVAEEREEDWTVPTESKPGDALNAELSFAWTAAKHAKSNAAVLTRDHATVGVGAGQMSRVDAVRLAIEKSEGRATGAVLASDAFFPFRDGPDLALDAGVTGVIQPGGSRRDEEVIAACDERGVPMVFTGRRHFRH